MRRIFGLQGAGFPRLGELGLKAGRPVFEAVAARFGLDTGASAAATEQRVALSERLRRGERVHLLGVNMASHGTGAALVEASQQDGVQLICNNEEERFRGQKHFAGFPELSLDALQPFLDERGLRPDDLGGVVAGWDFAELAAHLGRWTLEDLPGSLAALHPASWSVAATPDLLGALTSARQLRRRLGGRRPPRITGLRHHDNHAAFSWAASPFAQHAEPVIVTVIDGVGDDGPVSLYLAQPGDLRLLQRTPAIYDSLGALYAMLSSTQGGWPPLSSEGRWMGAAAWGDGDRLTNHYYRRLRGMIQLGPEGRVTINRALVRWYRLGSPEVYSDELTEVLGPPILPDEMWNPDAVLSPQDIVHAPTSPDRLDKAAACQMLFEDALFHVVDHLLRTTGASRLVMTGGTALNCVASMRLLDRFDEAWFSRNLGRENTRLHLWVPPTPGDAGAAMGAAWNLALAAGAPAGPPLRHAFWCGSAFDSTAIRRAVEATGEDDLLAVGDLSDPERRDRVADLLAYMVSQGGIVGIYQGRAETGPRALGHRTIVADPRRSDSMARINDRVKMREPFRPLAPMATLKAARELFELSDGASDDDYNAYHYMVLTTMARPEARERVPSVVHHDGTARVQVVPRDVEPFCHAYLEAMGRRAGVELSVNTSLNVGAPIVQTPAQAVETLHRARGMHGMLMVGADGEGFLVWHRVRDDRKDGGDGLRAWIADWQEEVGVQLPG
jgi:carbamoyltransferase